MNQKIQLIFKFCFLYVMIFSGCSMHSDPVLNTTPDVEQRKNEDCIPGTLHTFIVDQVPPPPHLTKSVDFAFQLSSGQNPYYSADCMCNVVQYEFVFDQLPLPLGSGITVHDGVNEISYDIDLNLYAPHYTIVVNDPTILGDAAENLYISFEDDNFSANLVYSGGLCVIDNIGGFFDHDTTTLYFSPIVVMDAPAQTGNDSIQKVFIPTAITVPK